MSRVAVVILNWNGREFLERFLPFLVSHSNEPGVELVVADNASEDDSITFLQESYPEIRVIALDRNYGFAGGYNQALKEIDAEYFMLLNSDIEVQGNWLEPLVRFLDTHDSAAACSPIILDLNKRDHYEYAGAAGGYIDRYGYAFCRGRIFDKVGKMEDPITEPTNVFWTTGACMLIRSKLFRDAGGFDDHFFAHMEEIDLCWRLKNMGYALAVVPESKVFHVGGGTLPKSNPFKTYLNFRNNLFLLYKNLPDDKLSSVVRKRMYLDGLSALLFLVKFRFGDLRAIYRAHREFFNHRKTYRQFREQFSEKIRQNRHPEIYQRSIVYDYFVAGRRQFKDLRDGFAQRMDMAIFNKNRKDEE